MKAVLFDLDGTLLDIDIEAFLAVYFRALAEAVETFAHTDDIHARVMKAIHDSTGAMMQVHPGRTNEDVFAEEYELLSGFSFEECRPVFERFYEEVFPGLGEGIGPSPGTREALDAARNRGMRVAVATNPIFPLRAIEHRMSWAGVSPEDVDVITSFETMTACKPQPAYFRETAAMLDVPPASCLMVGDDPVLDLAAADIGMKTFYVGSFEVTSADYRGTLTDLADLLTRID